MFLDAFGPCVSSACGVTTSSVGTDEMSDGHGVSHSNDDEERFVLSFWPRKFPGFVVISIWSDLSTGAISSMCCGMHMSRMLLSAA